MEESSVTVQVCLYCESPSPMGPYCCDACEILERSMKLQQKVIPQSNPFDYLDTSDFKNSYVQKDSVDYNFLIFCEGLHCSSCVHLLEKLPEFDPEVLEARVNFAQSTVALRLSDAGSLARVAWIIQELGYKPTVLTPQDDLEKKYQMENRRFMRRIGVAGFCAGNIMLFVIPIYAGLAGTWAQVFNWLSFALFLPILFYSAVPFYKGAWNSLKYKVINIDLPVTIALLTSFLLSLVNLVRGDGAIYFDSTASFMFLILSARFLLKRVQQNYLAPSRLKSFFQTEKYVRLNGDIPENIPWGTVNPGDVLKIQRLQNLPSDCELMSESAIVDMSLFNGESLPKTFTQGMTLFAGTKVINSDVLVKVKSHFSESQLGQLFQKLDQGALKKSSFVALTDKLAQRLILTVFSIAAIFFALYASVDLAEAFNRSLALIVLACPCALAFGSPLTFGLALKKAQKIGILLKDSSSLERLLKIKNIFFDKTGTLTEGALTVSYLEPEEFPDIFKSVILALEEVSYHPIAFALRQKFSGTTPARLDRVQEKLGFGVSGYLDDSFFELRPLSENRHDEKKAIEFFKNGQSLARIYFSDPLRKESAALIVELKKRGYHCHLLSGDKKSWTYQVGLECGLEKENIHAELYPEDKELIISKYPQTCMIGDGANDSLALQSAAVGIAVKGSVDLSLSSADIYFTRGGLNPLIELLGLAKTTQRTLIRNLSLSIVYNVVGGVLALLGFIDPMMAAILMPLSSALIVMSSLWGFR